LFYKIKPSGELIKINTYNSTGYIHDVCKHNDRLYATSDYGLETWGINAVGALSYSGISTSTIGDSRKLAYYNGYLYSSTNIDNTVALYSIQTSGARFERFLTVPDLNMYQRMSLMGGDSQFLYFNNDASGLCFYQNDTSGNLIHKHTIPKTQHESERYTALIYPSGEFEWDKHNLTYTLTRGKVYQEYGGLNTWNLHYAFEPTEENSPILIKCRDHAVLDYKIIDELSRNVDVNIEYSDDNGCTWSTCDRFKDYETIQYLGDGITDLASSPSGEWHSFYWDFVKPFGYNVEYPYCQMRITPSISKRN